MKSNSLMTLVILNLLMCVPALGAEWEVILDRLQKNGVNQVGDLNIGQLENEIRRNVQWKTIDEKSRPSFAGNRRSAYYVIDDKTVYKAQQLTDNLKKIESQLELHEALGALGYEDQAYSLSTSLEMISKAQNSEMTRYMVDVLGSSVFSSGNLRRLQSDGIKSGPGEGGGGDIIALYVKSAVFKQILSRRDLNSREILKYFPFVNFEPQYNPKEQYISLDYRYRFGERSGRPIEGVPIHPVTGDQEKLTIWVPVLKWNDLKSHRDRLVREVTQKVVELMPYRGTPNDSTITHETCRNQSVTYLQPSASDVLRIQMFRASVIGGCEMAHLFGPFSTEIGIIVPKIDQNYRQHYRAPNYTCRLKENNRLVRSADLNEIVPTSDAKAGEVVILDSQAEILGLINRNEKLEITEIGYLDRGRGSKKMVRFNGRSQTVRTSRYGINYSLSCFRRPQ